MKRQRAFFLIVMVAVFLLPAQETEKKYCWPLTIRDGVSSAFQEFRSNHFHAGIDIRTLQLTGFPVLAIADGRIERISVSNRGYGRLLRLRHADGNYSLYGHLERFRADIEAVVSQVRSARGRRYFSDYILPQPPVVRRGEVIAYSGESGAGFAHLHLEVHDAEHGALNPLRLIGDLSSDAHAPLLKGLLVRSRDGSQVHGECGEFYYKLKREGLVYTLERPLEISGACDLALEAIDLSDVRHVIAPCSLEASLDGKPVFAVFGERLLRDDNNQLGMMYDMAYSTPGNYFFNLCSQPGFALEKTGGRLADGLEQLALGAHEIRVAVADQAGNRSLALIPVEKVPAFAPRAAKKGAAQDENGVMQRTEFITFINHGVIVIKAGGFPYPAANLKLRVTQGDAEQVVAARESASGVYFAFQPLNHELRMMLRFELSRNGMTVEARQKTLQVVLLRNQYPQTVRCEDFAAEFGPTVVRDPTVLLLEKVALQPDLPMLAGPVRTGPVHFAFLDTALVKFRTPAATPNPEQLGIFKFQPATRRWTYLLTRPDQEPGYLSARVLTAGTFALLRDVFPPEISLRRLESHRLEKLNKLFVRLSDRGKGIDESACRIFLNGRRIDGDFDADWGHFQLEELSGLKKGANILYVRAADWGGNRAEKTFIFSLK